MAHSLGGLLVKQILRTGYDNVEPRWLSFAQAVRGVIFLATPHAGSNLATVIGTLRRLVGPSVAMGDLIADAPNLISLKEWYARRSSSLNIETASYAENQAMRLKGVRFGLVVSRESAEPGVGKATIPVDADHLTIARPGSRTDALYKSVLSVLQDWSARNVSTAIVPDTPPVAPATFATGTMTSAFTGTESTQLPDIATESAADIRAPDSLDAPPNNLPRLQTSFVGRETEIAEIVALLDKHQLVTLVGTGGLGKTRTSLQVAAQLLDRWDDGAWFIELAPLTSGEYIAPTIAHLVGIRLATDADPVDGLVSALQAKQALLIFDNCEHLVPDTARVVAAFCAHVLGSRS